MAQGITPIKAREIFACLDRLRIVIGRDKRRDEYSVEIYRRENDVKLNPLMIHNGFASILLAVAESKKILEMIHEMVREHSSDEEWLTAIERLHALGLDIPQVINWIEGELLKEQTVDTEPFFKGAKVT